MTDQDQHRQGQRQEGMRPLPTVGRAGGLIAVWEWTRREDGMRRGEFGLWVQEQPWSVTEWPLWPYYEKWQPKMLLGHWVPSLS